MGRRRSLFALSTVGVVVFAVAGVVSGQDETPGTPALRQLLAEVRGLRSDMASASAAGIRAQVLVGRLQMQEQRIATLGQQLVEAQGNAVALEQTVEASAARVRALQDDRGTVEQRDANARELEALAAASELDARRLADLHAQEAALQSQLDQEQARWHDVNNRLDELEQSLVR